MLKEGEYIGQTAYGVEKLSQKHKETCAQKWIGLISKEKEKALTCINEGIYGSSCNRGEIRLSLLRSPAYAAHPCRGRQTLESGRFIPRTDQGERIFRIWLTPGSLMNAPHA